MAYLVQLSLPKCQECKREATCELRGLANQPIGPYCSKHGQRALKERDKLEQTWCKEGLGDLARK